MSDREQRVTALDRSELRATSSRGIRGLAAVYDTPALIGGFSEEIRPGAFDDAIRDGDVRALYNHDINFPLARQSAGNLGLESTRQGLRYTISEMPRSREDVLEAIQRGDVSGSSFSFTVSDSGETWTERDGTPHRIIHRVDELFDVGPVTMPAYKSTSVAARSLRRGGGVCPGPDCPDPSYRLRSGDGDGTRRRQLQAIEAEIGAAELIEPVERTLPPKLARWAKSLRPTILHEAGHAVAGVACGLKVKRIEFDYRNHRPTGSARVVFTSRGRQKVPPLVTYAGPVAQNWGERKPSQLKLRRMLESETSADFDHLRGELAMADGVPGFPRTMRELHAETCATLRASWSAVEDVADAIADAPGGTLDGKEIHAICRKHNVSWTPAQR